MLPSNPVAGHERRRVLTFFGAVTWPLALSMQMAAQSQNWPQRTVKIIVPLPPGGGTVIATRLFAERLAARWGQPVVVENRQGGDGIPAVTPHSLASRDNHTLLLSLAASSPSIRWCTRRLPYDPASDLVPITSVTDNFLAIAATGR